MSRNKPKSKENRLKAKTGLSNNQFNSFSMLSTSCIGHLGGDAVCKSANGKEFTTFRIAHTSRWTNANGTTNEETCWVDCVMQGKPNVIEFLKKGQLVYVSGSTSLRVYSSQKDRCMKAGLTINVRQLELLGGRADEVPSKLYSKDGSKEVSVFKYFYAPDMKREPNTEEYVKLVSRSNDAFLADRSGWVTRVKTEGESE